VLWLADVQNFPKGGLTVLQRLELTATGFVPTATLSVPPTLVLATPMLFYRSSALPVLIPDISAPVRRAAVPVYLPEERLLRLEHLDDEVLIPQASASFFWGDIALSSGVRIRAVPTAP
jgi:hypothetical protein